MVVEVRTQATILSACLAACPGPGGGISLTVEPTSKVVGENPQMNVSDAKCGASLIRR